MRSWFLVFVGLFLLAGCADSSTKGNVSERDQKQDIKINNTGPNSYTILNFPVEYLAETDSTVRQATAGTASFSPKTALGYQGTGALEDGAGNMALEDISNTIQRWQDNRKQDSDNPITNAPAVQPVPVVVPPPVGPEPIDPKPDVKPKFSKKYHHYNPASWEGKGSSIVMCPGDPRMDYCQMYTQTMTVAQMMKLHPSQDKGRDVWTIYDRPGLDGIIVCTRDKKDYAYDISGTGGMQYGECGAVSSIIDLSKVKWLHTDVSGWPITSKLDPVKVTSSSITLPYDKAKVWPSKEIRGKALNANPWIFIKRGNQWYAATFEWLRPGQTTKAVKAVKGDHIKKSPLKDFVPKNGETYGFMVSGLARDTERNVQERTNIVMHTWGGSVVKPSVPVGKTTVAYKYAGRTNGDRPTWRLKGSLKVGSKFTFKCGPVTDMGVAKIRSKGGIGWEKGGEVVKNSDSYNNEMAILIDKRHKANFKAVDCSITLY